jgi:hypothetical protein
VIPALVFLAQGTSVRSIPMARWFHNRPYDHCDEHEIKVAKLLDR